MNQQHSQYFNNLASSMQACTSARPHAMMTRGFGRAAKNPVTNDALSHNGKARLFY
jgi:hypothetical protein